MNDLISRSELKNYLLDSKPDDIEQSDINFLTGDIKISLKFVLKIIDSAPTVDLEKRSFIEGYKEGCEYGKKCYERPQGEWIMQRHDLDGCFYTCSNCGRMIRVSLFIDDPEDNETLADYPFCHCGADMRKGSAE